MKKTVAQQTKPPHDGLLHRSLSAAGWNYLGMVVRAASQFVLGIILARLLGPEPFGLVAIAWLILGLGNLIADFGLASALVQRQEITGKDVRYVFTMQMLAGVVMTVLVVMTAPLVAAFFKSEDAIPVIQAMGALFLIQASGQTATSLLRRHLEFKTLQTYSIGSYLFSYLLVGLPLAWTGSGAWALVAAQLLQAVLYSIAANLHIRHSWLPTFKSDATGMFAFGSKILAGNLTSWGISNLDSVMVGRLFGPIALGFYNRGMNLVATPMNALTSSLQGVLFSAYSRSGNADKDKARSAYLASVGLIACIMAPAFAAISVIPGTVIAAVYGEHWMQVALLLTPLALAMPVNAVLAVGGPLITGFGAAGQDAAVQAVCVAILLPVVWLASQLSLEAVAWAVLGVYCLRALLISCLALRLVSGSWQQFVHALAGPVLLGLLAAMLSALLDRVLTQYVHSDLLRLGLVLGLAAVAIVLLLIWQGKFLFCPHTRSILVKVSCKLPRAMGVRIANWGSA